MGTLNKDSGMYRTPLIDDKKKSPNVFTALSDKTKTPPIKESDIEKTRPERWRGKLISNIEKPPQNVIGQLNRKRIKKTLGR